MAKIVSRISLLPFSVTELKLFLRVTHDDEDAYLLQLIKSARQFVEMMTNETMTQATYLEYFDWDGSEYLHPRILNPSSITNVEYLNASKTWVDLVESPFELTPGSEPPSFRLISTDKEDNDANFWTFMTSPSENDPPNLRVTYVAGAATVAEIPEHFIDVAYNYCGYFYENRQAANTPKFLIEHATINRKKHDI